MKKVLKLLVCLILMIPIFIKAYTITNYRGSINYTNSYINRFADKNKYLLFGQKYDFAGGKAVQNNDYKSGGLLSYDEYNASKGEYSSYLATGRGRDYWTITSNGTNNQYYIENGVLSKNKDLQSGIRVTQYVQPGVNVDGIGTYNNPWVFREQFSVTINVENSKHGVATPSFKMVDPNTKFKFTITDKPGYEYKRSDCVLTKRATSNEYETKPIKEDTICTLSFDKRFITITYACTLGTGSVSSQVVEYGTNYSIADYTCERTGYHQTIWKTSGGNEWTKGAQGKFEVENGVRGLVKNKLDLQAGWTPNELVFDAQTLNAGNYATAYTSNAFTGASNGTGSYTYTLKSGYPTGATIDSTNRKISFTSSTAAGTYNVVVHAKDNNSGSEKDATMTIVINKIPAVLTCSNKTYTGSAQTACSCSGGTAAGTYSATNAGTHTAKCTPDSNHTAPADVSWTMAKAASTAPSITGFTVNYDGKSHCATVSGGTSGLTKQYSYCKGTTCTDWSNWSTNSNDICATAANSWRVRVRVAGNTNYNDSSASDTTITVNKVAATLSCSDKTYNGSEQTGCSCSGGAVGGTYKAKNAGTYTASCTGDSNHTNPSNKTWKIIATCTDTTLSGCATTTPCRTAGITCVFNSSKSCVANVCNAKTDGSYWYYGSPSCNSATTLYIVGNWSSGDMTIDNAKSVKVCWYYKNAGPKEYHPSDPSKGTIVCGYIQENCTKKWWGGADCSMTCK